MPILPLPSPPLNQIGLPPPPFPSRKLHAVRFSTLTPSAFHTSTPLRPTCLPFSFGPKSWADGALLHFPMPGLSPSTTTRLRFIPRRWRPALVTNTPPPLTSAAARHS